MKKTLFQIEASKILSTGKSLLLIAPTGSGKTYAVTSDLLDTYKKTIYAAPLRALGNDIFRTVSKYKRNDQPISCVIHHGDIQDSNLFTEEVIVTTYDQIVCAVPGLPLSLPLKAGHAIAGATLLSRLIFDEGHLAWAISKHALSILFGVIGQRKKLGLQTVLMTATMPKHIAEKIAKEFDMEHLVVGEGSLEKDQSLELRNNNRKVEISQLDIYDKRAKANDLGILVKKLSDENGEKKIYFSNTVDRLQIVYDLLNETKQEFELIMLHNRMPTIWRGKAESMAKKYFGKDQLKGPAILLTNQVAEAGLDISAHLVISDPAPVDTLIQRAGRCARWFRDGKTKGKFVVIKSTKELINKELSHPYKFDYIETALKNIPQGNLSWSIEMDWIKRAWMGGEEKAQDQLEKLLTDTTFALNLFDRAAQKKNPGEIASVFRDILSVNVAVSKPENITFNKGYSIDFDDTQSLIQDFLTEGKLPETSSISLKRAYSVRSKAKGKVAVIRYIDDKYVVQYPDYIKPDDLVIFPSTIAYLHNQKGLCFKEDTEEIEINHTVTFDESIWHKVEKNIWPEFSNGAGFQTLIQHTSNVMDNTMKYLTSDIYKSTLTSILKKLEPDQNTDDLTNTICMLIYLASGFHDIGKANKLWQQKIREIDTQITTDELVGRSNDARGPIKNRIRLPPHTPPAYSAFIKAAELLLGKSENTEYLIKTIALASARHHSSILNPASVGSYNFNPDSEKTERFIQAVLQKVNAPKSIVDNAKEVLLAGMEKPREDDIPLLFPNDDLFSIYALAGRAILLADREDASGINQGWI